MCISNAEPLNDFRKCVQTHWITCRKSSVSKCLFQGKIRTAHSIVQMPKVFSFETVVLNTKRHMLQLKKGTALWHTIRDFDYCLKKNWRKNLIIFSFFFWAKRSFYASQIIRHVSCFRVYFNKSLRLLNASFMCFSTVSSSYAYCTIDRSHLVSLLQHPHKGVLSHNAKGSNSCAILWRKQRKSHTSKLDCVHSLFTVLYLCIECPSQPLCIVLCISQYKCILRCWLQSDSTAIWACYGW